MNLDLPTFKHYRKEFSLGHLTTESFHPLSKNLSSKANTELNQALLILKKIDTQAFDQLKNYLKQIYSLHKKCQKVLSDGGRIYLVGCGATGRLAISMEKLFREKFNSDKVTSFMAGGDFALIKSVENFEDEFSYGARQLADLGCSEQDLVIGITEGGETSFVIGAVEKACELSQQRPYFLYCNPNEELSSIHRSNLVLENNNIEKLCLAVGPMAISGSTRMQATTVQMITVGLALLYDFKDFTQLEQEYLELEKMLYNLDYCRLANFIKAEAKLYSAGGVVQYYSTDKLGISVLTDTTERSPTFNLRSFEMKGDQEIGKCYLSILGESNDQSAWKSLLSRSPRALNWKELNHAVDLDKIYSFDISEKSFLRRQKINSKIKRFLIDDKNDSIKFSFDNEIATFNTNKNDLFFKHIALKLLLNSHSTLVMGRLNRFEGNVMTYVRASNMKLIDRALRYILELLRREKVNVSEDMVIQKIFEQNTSSDKPIVLRIKEELAKTP